MLTTGQACARQHSFFILSTAKSTNVLNSAALPTFLLRHAK
jgi:hypothetical protein